MCDSEQTAKVDVWCTRCKGAGMVCSGMEIWSEVPVTSIKRFGVGGVRTLPDNANLLPKLPVNQVTL